ncbi:monooxygenase [Paenibacillus yonginensis]|uniref:Monooxygenase n=1 Tax=Paenibacillus yonginensis TaxID=1462996 RepID=A0A1B1MZ35_9BACL|nr:NAD(P)/FAD-dependent oxidoreductase [Paenibacillus yonginensis]ANS74431.1 monooxygenase [Paenibacillus yonginensis]
METMDCIIVGAGPSGIGLGIVLQDLKLTNFCVLERDSVGASFRLWPKEMRMITPSFTGNAYGLLDLNTISIDTSPAFTLGTEHPSGQEYADYLEAVAKYKELPIQTGVDVTRIEPTSEGFLVYTSKGVMSSRFVVWAAGEFQYPNLGGFPGAEHCIHNSLVQSWDDHVSEERIVIGGFESGADSAIHLSRAGTKVTIIDRGVKWLDKDSSDPSMELSPFTKDRVKALDAGAKIDFAGGLEVQWVEPDEQGGFVVYAEDMEGTSRLFKTAASPILATGFKGSLGLIESLLERGEDGQILLSQVDESTRTPGLFVSGPSVVHQHLKLCFIYKFRQRFAVIAGVMAERLGLSTEALENYRRKTMLLDDLSCCEEDCTC